MEIALSWSVEVLDRYNGRFLNSPNSCLPISLNWDDFAGPTKALIRCPCEQLSMEDWRTRLGQDVRVYDPQGRLAWWGYLERVSHEDGELQHRVGMSEVANRVAVRYKDLGSSETEQTYQTAWVDDLESQAVYGIKEKVYNASFTQRATAEWMALVQLHENAWPEIRLAPRTRNTGDGQRAYYLECRGWMQTLSWRIWPGLNALTAHSPFQQGTQSLGNSLANRKMAQSFVLNNSLQYQRLAVRARKQGSPTDMLKFSLQPDLAGRPSGVDLGFQLLNPDELSAESYGWKEVNLPVPISLDSGLHYWLVLERTGAVNPDNFYLLGLDENQGYQAGTLLLYDETSAAWKSRLPGSDLLFRLTGLLDQVEQVRSVVAHAGQFLQFAEYDFGQSQDVPPLGDEGKDCLEVFSTLIMQGNAVLEPLCAGIDPNRNLKVWRKVGVENANLYLSPYGSLETRFGQPLEAPWQAVGQWLLSEPARPLYLSSLTLQPGSGKLRFNG